MLSLHGRPDTNVNLMLQPWVGAAVRCDWCWKYLSTPIIRSSPVAIPVPVLAIVEAYYLDFSSHPDLKGSENHFSSIFFAISLPKALQLSLSLFLPCFSSLRPISWLKKPLVSFLLSFSSIFLSLLSSSISSPHLFLILSAPLPLCLAFIFLFTQFWPHSPFWRTCCVIMVSTCWSLTLQLLPSPGLDLHCDSEVN